VLVDREIVRSICTLLHVEDGEDQNFASMEPLDQPYGAEVEGG
jgi:hypothetical protein